MKAKVLMYAKNGNDVITKNVELEKYDEHIYLQNIGDGCYNVIGEIDNVFFYIERTWNIERLDRNALNHYIGNFVDIIMNNKDIFISNVYLQVFRKLGKVDYLPLLLQKRDQWIETVRKEEEDHLAWLKEQERKEKERFEEKYKESLEDYKETNVKPEMFLEMLLRNNIYVHPRTKFAITNNLQAVSARGVWNKRGKRGDTQKVFDAISELNEKLNIK